MEVSGSLTCPAGIIAACLGEVWGDGEEENAFCHTLVHNLHLSLAVKPTHTVVIHISSSLSVCVFLGVSACLLVLLPSVFPSVCLLLTNTHIAMLHYLPCSMDLCACVCVHSSMYEANKALNMQGLHFQSCYLTRSNLILDRTKPQKNLRFCLVKNKTDKNHLMYILP